MRQENSIDFRRPTSNHTTMSPNNLILVAHTARRSYVLPGLDADTQWNKEYASAEVLKPDRKYCYKRSRALLLAHDIQNRLQTEYGVREMFLEERPKRPPLGKKKEEESGMNEEEEEE